METISSLLFLQDRRIFILFKIFTYFFNSEKGKNRLYLSLLSFTSGNARDRSCRENLCWDWENSSLLLRSNVCLLCFGFCAIVPVSRFSINSALLRGQAPPWSQLARGVVLWTTGLKWCWLFVSRKWKAFAHCWRGVHCYWSHTGSGSEYINQYFSLHRKFYWTACIFNLWEWLKSVLELNHSRKNFLLW